MKLPERLYRVLGKWPTWRTILYHVFIFIFNSAHHSSTSCSSSGEANCVKTTSGHRHRVTVTRGCIDTICLSWWWARCARKMYRVKYKNKYMVKNRASRWSFTKNHKTMHGQQNVKFCLYRGADKSLARPRRKQATATEDFEFHISYL
jgi:hypothetical protein